MTRTRLEKTFFWMAQHENSGAQSSIPRRSQLPHVPGVRSGLCFGVLLFFKTFHRVDSGGFTQLTSVTSIPPALPASFQNQQVVCCQVPGLLSGGGAVLDPSSSSPGPAARDRSESDLHHLLAGGGCAEGRRSKQSLRVHFLLVLKGALLPTHGLGVFF